VSTKSLEERRFDNDEEKKLCNQSSRYIAIILFLFIIIKVVTKKGIEYILRYCGRPCFAQYRIIDIRDDYITFWYQRHEDDKFVVERIHGFEFIGRLIKHIPERNFKTIRYCGFYSSKFKSILKDCRKLWDDLKASFHKSMTKWRNMSLSSFNKDPLLCSCGYVMMFSYRVPRLE